MVSDGDFGLDIEGGIFKLPRGTTPSLGRLDHTYLLDNTIGELTPLHELSDDVVFSRVVLEKLVDLDYVRMIQVPQNMHLTEVSTRNNTKATHIGTFDDSIAR